MILSLPRIKLLFSKSRFAVINSLNIRLISNMEKKSLSEIVNKLEEFADPKLAEEWDNVGLLIEPSQPHFVSTVLLTNDLTQNVLDEALHYKTNLIISYHPIIFAPLKRITQSSWKEKILVKCLENRIAVYSPHTAWDAVHGGVADSLASAFSKYSECVEAIRPLSFSNSEEMYDVITSRENSSLLSQFSAKIIYKLMSENSGSGEKEIYRILTDKSQALKIAATLPDTYVNKVQQIPKESSKNTGMGRIVKLKENGCSLIQCVDLIKSYTKLDHVRLAKAVNHSTDSLIKTIALVPGSGGSLLKGISADLFITGEMFHHDILDANHKNISVILTNHSDSERPFLDKFKKYLSEIFPSVEIIVSNKDQDPLRTV